LPLASLCGSLAGTVIQDDHCLSRLASSPLTPRLHDLWSLR